MLPGDREAIEGWVDGFLEAMVPLHMQEIWTISQRTGNSPREVGDARAQQVQRVLKLTMIADIETPRVKVERSRTASMAAATMFDLMTMTLPKSVGGKTDDKKISGVATVTAIALAIGALEKGIDYKDFHWCKRTIGLPHICSCQDLVYRFPITDRLTWNSLDELQQLINNDQPSTTPLTYEEGEMMYIAPSDDHSYNPHVIYVLPDGSAKWSPDGTNLNTYCTVLEARCDAGLDGVWPEHVVTI